MLRILCVLMLIAIGCGKKVEIEKQPETKTEVVQETKQETQPKRNLRARESVVVGSLNAKVEGREQFRFVFADDLGEGRYFVDPEKQIRVLFRGDSDDIEWAMANVSVNRLLDEKNFRVNIKSFLNVANRMVTGVSPSIVDDADSWLDLNLVPSCIAKELPSTSIRGFKLEITRLNTSDDIYIGYKISSAD